MSLTGQININTHYTRSVNIERDANAIEVVKAYIPTSRAIRTFETIISAFNEKQAPRAWSLVGPYGSGKSSFSVFLSHLLSDPAKKTTQTAYRVLNRDYPALGRQFKKQTRQSQGFLKVLIVGAPEPMAQRIVQGLLVGAKAYWPGRAGTRLKVIKSLEALITQPRIAPSDVLNAITQLQERLIASGSKGLILLIDEMGKFLEYEARHYGANDIYLLQALAEHACKGSKANLLLFVMLHQSFEQYAKGLGESLKSEWSKVQGRFEEVPFLESAEQILRVVAAAFESRFTSKEQAGLDKRLKKIVAILAKQKALPGVLDQPGALALFQNCYPLHPVTAIMLPLLCQKVAQNERTLFSYLGSHEQYGLLDMLDRLETIGQFILPHHIYDYFITNQPAVLGDYLTHRRWAEVVTAVERVGDVEQRHIDLIKTIGILNIIGAKGGFKASEALLASGYDKPSELKSSIALLESLSVINYRRFNGEYRVWQGSDFDLELALQEALDNLGDFSLAEALNQDERLPPIVARRYTIEKGNLRYFMPYFIDPQSFKSAPKQASEPRIIFFQATGQDDEKLFNEQVKGAFSNQDILVLCLSGSQIKDAIAESIALRHVANNKPELNLDPVAGREYTDRLNAAEHVESTLLQALIDQPQQNEWYYNQKQLLIPNKRRLQERLSEILEQIYPLSPRIFNELINRDKPSAQANAGRRILMIALLEKSGQAALGIQKYPPEKSIYKALVEATGLHVKNKTGQWVLQRPPPRSDPANLGATWKALGDFFATTESEPKTILALNQTLLAPPYGVRAGILPVLYLIYYLINQHEIAIYEKRRYVAYLTPERIERFIKRPDEFTFQRIRIKGVKAALIQQYASVLLSDDEQAGSVNVLKLAKPLAMTMGKLPDYTQKTKRGLSKEAQAVRSAFHLASSPERLLFQDLPKALGLEEQTDRTRDQLSMKLTATLYELEQAYNELLKRQKQRLATAFNLDPKQPLSSLRKTIRQQCEGLENYTVDTLGIRAFIVRLVKTGQNELEWFQNILMYLAHKPSSKWSDSDQDTAEFRLIDFAQRVNDLEKLRIQDPNYQELTADDCDVYLLRSVKKGGDIRDQVVAVNAETAESLSLVRQSIAQQLEQLGDPERGLAALAQVVDEFMIKHAKNKRGTADV